MNPDVQAITREQFLRSHGKKYGGASIHREVSWWASTGGHLLGTVIHDLADSDFSYVVLGRDEHGVFRAFDLKCSMPTRKQAEQMLQAAMLKWALTGETMFPQDDLPGEDEPDDLKTRKATDAEVAAHPDWYHRVCRACGSPRFSGMGCGWCGDPA